MATLRKPKSVYRTVRYHAALNPGHTLSVSGARQEPITAHIRQSDCDSGCAIHCVSMALIILGLVKRSAVINQAKRKSGIAAQLYRAMGDSWFEGINAKPLLDALHQLELPVLLRLQDGYEGVDAFAIEALQRGLLTLLAYESERNRHRHWVLGVGASGIETGESFAVDTLLVLCPSSDPVPLASHNGRLHRDHAITFAKDDPPSSWQFESMPYSSEPVRLMSAISMELAL